MHPLKCHRNTFSLSCWENSLEVHLGGNLSGYSGPGFDRFWLTMMFPSVRDAVHIKKKFSRLIAIIIYLEVLIFWMYNYHWFPLFWRNRTLETINANVNKVKQYYREHFHVAAEIVIRLSYPTHKTVMLLSCIDDQGSHTNAADKYSKWADGSTRWQLRTSDVRRGWGKLCGGVNGHKQWLHPDVKFSSKRKKNEDGEEEGEGLGT